MARKGEKVSKETRYRMKIAAKKRAAERRAIEFANNMKRVREMQTTGNNHKQR